MSAHFLEISGLTGFYGDFQALFGIEMVLDAGETVALIGANGAGKSTLMRALTGIVKVGAGQVRLAGERIDHLDAPDILLKGIATVPEGRRLFSSLTVEENLLIGAQARKGEGPWNLRSLYELFPDLQERRRSPGTALSGGQQQMVAIGRALMSNPRVLLCDEISLGLAPVVIKNIYDAVPRIKASGTSIVIVEQDISQALKVADRVYCMAEGRITLEGRPADLSRHAIHDAYFGAHA